MLLLSIPLLVSGWKNGKSVTWVETCGNCELEFTYQMRVCCSDAMTRRGGGSGMLAIKIQVNRGKVRKGGNRLLVRLSKT